MLVKKRPRVASYQWPPLGEMEASLGLDYFKARTTMRNSLGVDQGEAGSVEPAAAMATAALLRAPPCGRVCTNL